MRGLDSSSCSKRPKLEAKIAACSTEIKAETQQLHKLLPKQFKLTNTFKGSPRLTDPHHIFRKTFPERPFKPFIKETFRLRKIFYRIRIPP